MEKEIVVVLVGFPNCGKSTLFNKIASVKVDVSNFPGTTVKYTETRTIFDGRRIKVIDLPGIYSLHGEDLAEKTTINFLLSKKIDVIVNVLDSSTLPRGFDLTISILEMKKPTVVVFNMWDEAQKKGVEIDEKRFYEIFGVKSVKTIATKGKGITELFRNIIEAYEKKIIPKDIMYDKDIEESIKSIQEALQISRFHAIRLLEGEPENTAKENEIKENEIKETETVKKNEIAKEKRKFLAEIHALPEEIVFQYHRHSVAFTLFKEFGKVGKKQISLRDKIDYFLLTPLGSTTIILGTLLALFSISFKLGEYISQFIGKPYEAIIQKIPHTGIFNIFSGFLDGVFAGLGVVLPYLIPLLFFMSLYEQSGLLPRFAFMIDGFLHKFGIHGKSAIPIMLGFGCNIPAIMALRTLESERDRIITSLLIPFVSCSARSVVILALAGAFLGPIYALILYVINILIILTISIFISKMRKREKVGLIMDIPPLRAPTVDIILLKMKIRIFEFVRYAWPILIISSTTLSLLTVIGFMKWINYALSPLMKVLGVREELGITLIFGFLRKELVLAMISSALGVPYEKIPDVISPQEIFILTLFTMLYTPCVGTFTVIKREIGKRYAWISVLLNVSIAIIICTLLNFVINLI